MRDPIEHVQKLAYGGAVKIVIPGGRYRRPSSARKEAARDEKDTDGDEEWTRNGVGRVDVRGFRELRI